MQYQTGSPILPHQHKHELAGKAIQAWGHKSTVTVCIFTLGDDKSHIQGHSFKLLDWNKEYNLGIMSLQHLHSTRLKYSYMMSF